MSNLHYQSINRVWDICFLVAAVLLHFSLGLQHQASRRANTFPESLVRTLDLLPVLERVGDHCGTRRGRLGLLRHAKPDSNNIRARASRWSNLGGQPTSDDVVLSIIARSAEEAKDSWCLVEIAASFIEQEKLWPPLYPDGPLDASQTVSTDDDEWLQHSSVEDFSLEDIWQAEQVIRRLQRVDDWVQTHPAFVNQQFQMDRQALDNTMEAIEGTVKVSKVRSLTDATGSSAYTFDLDRSKKFPVLALLQKRGVPQEEMNEKIAEIKNGLALSILSAVATIDGALNAAAWLDVVFAKAAFGIARCGGVQCPDSNAATFHVRAFQHPLLEPSMAVPTDLLLGGEHCSSLVISGPNGGGKSLTLKSFGLLAALYKVAIPLASPSETCIPFYRTIFVSLGDTQNIQDGESTFTSKLNEYAKLMDDLRTIDRPEDEPSLVLLDELGSGTDESAGGCIGQALIEELSDMQCHVVATTHASRLKTFAYTNDKVTVASVILDSSTEQPSYQLVYGSIGQSNALSALKRSNPSFSDSFLLKVQGFMTESTDETTSSYITALSESLTQLQQAAETERRAAFVIRKATAQLASSYSNHLSRLEQTLDQHYLQLVKKHKAGELDTMSIIGGSLSEIRLVRQTVQSEAELLQSQGLRRVPASYEFRMGEAVVVIDESSAWHGQSVKIIERESADTVRVASTDGIIASFDLDVSKSFGRHQLAVWDFDSVWEDNGPTPAIPQARRRVNSVLASIDAASSTKSTIGGKTPSKGQPKFQSSRERKSAKRKRRK